MARSGGANKTDKNIFFVDTGMRVVKLEVDHLLQVHQELVGMILGRDPIPGLLLDTFMTLGKISNYLNQPVHIETYYVGSLNTITEIVVIGFISTCPLVLKG